MINLLQARTRRLAILGISSITALPVCFISLGVFPRYYSFYIMLPVVLLIFGQLPILDSRNSRLGKILILLLFFGILLPGSYIWSAMVQGWPSMLRTDHNKSLNFIKDSIHGDDVAWVDHRLWYDTKPIAKKTFSGLWRLQAQSAKSRDEVTVVITPSDSAQNLEPSLDFLPGKWEQTGASLQVPDFHRFIKINRGDQMITFVVFRRIDKL
jgi:hypothetical protein